MTPKVYVDSISADAAPPSGGKKLITWNFQMLKAFFTVVQIFRNYHYSIANLILYKVGLYFWYTIHGSLKTNCLVSIANLFIQNVYYAMEANSRIRCFREQLIRFLESA